MKTGWFLFPLFWCLSSHAQIRLQGRLTDANSGKPVAGASLTLMNGIMRQSVSDLEGAFSFLHLQPGSYTLKIRSLGYQTLLRHLELRKNPEHLEFRLSTASLLVQPLEVSAIRGGKNIPFTRTQVSSRELARSNLGQDLPYLLEQQPSVVVNSDAGTGIGYTGIYIRGTDATRINVTINGIPVNDAEDQGTYWVDIPDLASSTSNIQIQRGVGSSTNGAGAFGGTLNISTNQFHDSSYVRISNSYGSFHSWKNSLRTGTGLINHHFTLDARLSRISSDGYIDRASANLKSLFLSAAYLSSRTAIRFNAFTGYEKTYQAWDGVPQDSLKTHRTYNDLGLESDGSYYPNQTDNYEQDYYQLFLNHSISSNLNYSGAVFLTRGKGYYEEYKIGEDYASYGLAYPVLGSDTLRSTDLIRDLWLNNYFYGALFSMNNRGSILNWDLGGGWDRYDGKHYGDVVWAAYDIAKDYRYYYNEAHKEDFNIYWKGDKAFGSLSLYADLQFRNVRYQINGFDDNPSLIQHNVYYFFNPKAGIRTNLGNGRSAYLSFAQANKEPNRDDYEANLSQTPRPEHLQDWEAGMDQKSSRFSWHAGLYFMNYRDQLVLTGKINDVGAYTRTNIPRSFRAGTEWSLDWDFGNIWSLAANATFSQNKVLHFTEYIDNYDNGGQLAVNHGTTDIAFSPNWIGALSLSVKPVPNLELQWLGKYVGLEYMDNSSNKGRSLPAYFLNNIRGSFRIHPRWIRSITFRLLVNNLFNISYLNNGYTYSYIQNGLTLTQNNYFPQAGTNFFAGIDLNW